MSLKTTELRISADKLAKSYGIEFLDFAEVDWSPLNGPVLCIRGRRPR